jgi:hypothetical protein
MVLEKAASSSLFPTEVRRWIMRDGSGCLDNGGA